ncbi:hypothetical protein TIFTF001_026460 [Ficus carica]|uniref:F-box protein At3g26010-like beta-propeller domain-containing protein n=1 Tax=Ficus carica TaxID=3494 RepID=A0AA88DLB2_FICCA|nr:hypothetical protein TIFTF001_026460 [Ficus carica]
MENISVGNCRTGLLCHYLFGNGSAEYVLLDVVDDQECGVVVNPSLCFFSRTSAHVCASCNGWLLFSCTDVTDITLVNYNVFNFFTKQSFTPPQPQIRGPSIRTGLAVDGQHYQVVRIFNVDNNGSHLLEMEIYSSEKGVWRHERPLIPLPPDLPKLRTFPLYSNGAIHWELGGHLLVYCVHHGECKLIQLPNYVGLDKWSEHSLTYGQCLWESEGRVHYCYSDFDGIHTWLLIKDAEIEDYCSYHYNLRWKHDYSVMHETLVSRNPSIFVQNSLGFWHTGPSFASPVAYVDKFRTIYLKLPGVVVSYNLRTRTLKEICKYEFPKTNFQCCLVVPVVHGGDVPEFRANKRSGDVICLPTPAAKDMAEGRISICNG